MNGGKKGKMKRRKNGKLLLGLLIAVAFMGIGYAAITGISMLVNGSASVKSKGEMKVRFVRNDAQETAIQNPEENAIIKTGKHLDGTDIPSNTLEAEVTSDTTASFSANEMTEVGDYAEFTYNVVNESDGVDAMISFEVEDENDLSDYFEVSKTTDKIIISDGEVAQIKVKVKLVKVPKIENVTGNFRVTITANPAEQDESEGTISGTSQEVSSASSFAKALQNDEINTIELEKDITISKNANLVVDEDTTINFNGNTLTVQPGNLKVKDGAELVLSDDNGTGGITATRNAITVENGGELTVESGTYETTEFTGRGSVITIAEGADNAKITINGGTINADYFAVASYSDGEVEINGGEINSSATVKNTDESGATYHAYTVRLSKGHLTMNGGTVNGIHGGIGLIGTASATINGGTVTLNNSYEGAKDSFYCLYLEGNASAEVNDGTFINNGTNPLVYSSSTGLANLRGGAWQAKSTSAFNGPKPNYGKDVIKVYGGTYKKNTNGTLTDYDVSAFRAN